MISIKQVKTTDATLIALLGRITYSESHGHFISNKKDLLTYFDKAFSVAKITADIKNPNNLFYLAYLNELPVGYAKIVLENPFENKTEKSSCRLERIYILDDFLSKKIGQPFLNYLQEIAKKNKAPSMWLSVYIKNDRAIRFYKRNNFKDIGKLSFIVNDIGYENFVLSKKL